MKHTLILPLVLLCAGCDEWSIVRPPATSAGQSDPTVPLSTVQLPISLKTSALAASLMDTYRKKTLAAGATGELSADMIFEERTTVEKLVDIVIKPAEAGFCLTKKVPETVVEQVKVGVEGYSCALTPWRWGRCWRDVFNDVTKTVWKDVTECVPAVAEVIKQEMRPVIDIKEAILPTKVKLNYEALLRDLVIEADGNTLKIVGDVHLNGWLDLTQGLLRESLTVKGALRCDSEITVTSKASVSLTENASIDAKVDDFSLDWRKLCVPGAVQAIDVVALTNPVLLIQLKGLSALLKNAIIAQLNNTVRKKSDDELNFHDDLLQATTKMQEALPIGEKAWLAINPKRVIISQLRSGGVGAANALIIDAGFAAEPKIVFADKPPRMLSGSIPFSTTTGPQGFALAIVGAVNLDEARGRIATEISKLLDERFDSQPLKATGVDLYQSGTKLVIGIQFSTKSNSKVLGTAYLWATPTVTDFGQAIRFDEVSFDVETKNVLAKAASWILNGAVEKTLSETKIDIGSPTRKFIEQNKAISTDVGFGTVTLTLREFSPKAVWLADGELRAWGLAKGTGAVELRAPALN